MSAKSKVPRRETKPRMNANGAKSPTIAFRVRGDLYDRLKASAETRGYSLSEEIEHRLNRSLDAASDHFAELALQLIADNWRAIQSLSRRKMVEDEFTLQACCEAAYRATELLAGVNGMNLHIGLLGSLGSKQINIEAGKQLGHAIVYHRELLHMKNPPEWATPVYEANVIEALTKRITDSKERVAEQPSPPAARFATPEEAAKAVPAENRDPTLFQQADFDEARGPSRDGYATPPDPVEPTPAPTSLPHRSDANAPVGVVTVMSIASC